MFLFPGFHHLSALQCEGLKIWDSACNCDFLSQLMLYPACANGPARLLTMSNFIGHQGKNGCHMQCPLKCHDQFLSSWSCWGSFMLATVNYDLYLFYCSLCSHSCPSNTSSLESMWSIMRQIQVTRGELVGSTAAMIHKSGHEWGASSLLILVGKFLDW